MNIGQVAQQSGISRKMIRYYEQIGLLDSVKRSDAGYRIYCEQDVKILSFLKHARELDFSSEQMKALLSLWKNPQRQSVEVKQLALQHIAALKQKIDQLQQMVDWLQHSVDHCSGDHRADCAILNHLEQGE
ncbi:MULTISPECIES: Cu(I)-responsive transcriptional regulator [unclassified Acinetobacter]|uniref:Cu(I)-responsive transcriptional regulator n=1 Tax=unclassified Acinetobacter TaxID=196816 RepID=UPI0029348DC9|nr:MULTISPECIES: Cu(I)-responsive transcriptional regulator [unclassified Acinetobacter]WOE32383.1 Cu(I)-responsive transcriptional regulator [Acinetobacter sp. SAAs470]WOE37856.1 Cu(I)-responsive transcriptional regulator [Acinetobacter sp. SAAs474]